MKQRMTGRFHYPLYLFGRYTVQDIVRLGLPTVAFYLLAPPLAEEPMRALLLSGTGAVLGCLWYSQRPYGKPVEYVVYHFIRWLVRVVVR